MKSFVRDKVSHTNIINKSHTNMIEQKMIFFTKTWFRHQNLWNKSLSIFCFSSRFLLQFTPSPLISLPFLSGRLFLSPPPILPSQWNLSAGVKAAGHLIIAAPVPERDQRWECPHRRQQPALLRQHYQLDKTVPHCKPEGPDPQQPKPTTVL